MIEILKWTAIIVSTGLAFIHLMVANSDWDRGKVWDAYYDLFQSIIWLLILNLIIS